MEPNASSPSERSAPAPRRRTTRRGVRVVELVTRLVITIGGIGTIAAVGLICVFLVGVALPLFAPAESEPEPARPLEVAERPLGLAVDELRRISWSVLEDGRLVASALHDGRVLFDEPLFDGARPTASAFPAGVERAAFGFSDGSIRLARLGFAVSYLDLADAPQELAGLAQGELAVLGERVVERISPEQLRLEEVVREVDAPLSTGLERPIEALALARVPNGLRAVAADEQGSAALVVLRESTNLLSGATSLRASRSPLPAPGDASGERAEAPRQAAVTGTGGSVWLGWEDGTLLRYDVRDPGAPRLVEETDLVPEPGERLEHLATLLGQSTLVSGDSLGRVRGWFMVRSPLEDGSERVELALAHDLPPGPGPVTALAAAERGRIVAAAFAGGAARVYHVTSDEELLALEPPEPLEVHALAIAPRQDALYLRSPRALHAWELDLGHPEASLGALFGRVWYEGYPAPAHVWQSSSGTDDFEPKLGLVPLVFGTLKATLYSMLFGVPLALLAAVYTSEFMKARWKSGVKSSIEMMASLPSVVLGFLAALVVAPFVQGVLSSVLASFFTIPIALLLGARLWQLLPKTTQIRLSGAPRMALMALALPLGVLAARLVGPLAERLLFGGDLIAWLDGGAGGAAGGWSVLLFPLAGLGLALPGRRLDDRLRKRARSWSEGGYAAAELARFLLLLVLAFLVARLAGGVLELVGLDPRGTLVGTYVQRNALIVGFVMGFAIVPIIYTLAEDALASVPDHLRQASLGAGATPWQTALRVVVPTATSGIFSALMIGLGRAVGETMIVLMATGNTPIMEWSVFNGFRTLSANIAVELPEAVQGDTHYRTLFLAALVLFTMTFVLNTFAEIVRQRFRKRAWQL
jgi:phosphate transport system permease protein